MKVIAVRWALCITFVLIFIILLVLRLNEVAQINDAVFTALSSLTIANVIINLYLYIKKKNNPAAFKQQMIEECDERNRALDRRAGFIAWCVSCVTLAVAVLVLYSLDYIVPAVFIAVVVIIHVLSYVVALMCLKKKY